MRTLVVAALVIGYALHYWGVVRINRALRRLENRITGAEMLAGTVLRRADAVARDLEAHKQCADQSDSITAVARAVEVIKAPTARNRFCECLIPSAHEKVLRGLNDGLSYQEIATRIGMTTGWVSYIADAMKAVLRKNPDHFTRWGYAALNSIPRDIVPPPTIPIPIIPIDDFTDEALDRLWEALKADQHADHVATIEKWDALRATRAIRRDLDDSEGGNDDDSAA
jgi:hypothetical protein